MMREAVTVRTYYMTQKTERERERVKGGEERIEGDGGYGRQLVYSWEQRVSQIPFAEWQKSRFISESIGRYCIAGFTVDEPPLKSRTIFRTPTANISLFQYFKLYYVFRLLSHIQYLSILLGYLKALILI